MSIISEKFNSKERLIVTPKGKLGIILALVLAISTFALYKKIQATRSTVTPATMASSELNSQSMVSALGRLEPRGEVIKLSTPSTGQNARIERILVKEGEWVHTNQIVVVLDTHSRLEAALEEAQAQLEVARANIAKVKAGAQTGEINAQKATLARLQAQLRAETTVQQAIINRITAELQGQQDALKASVALAQAEQLNAQADAQRYESLYKEGVISAQELDRKHLSANTSRQQLNESQANFTRTIVTLQQQLAEAKANRDKTIATLQKQLDEAKATLSKIAEVRPTDLQVAQAEVNHANASVKKARAELNLSYVRTPISGEILKIHAKPGETVVDPKQGITEIGHTNEMIVVAEVLEEDIGKVRLGQRATISSENQAFPGELKGSVIEIGRQIGKQDVLDSDPAADVDARVVEVKIGLPPQASQRVSGLTYANVVAKINI